MKKFYKWLLGLIKKQMNNYFIMTVTFKNGRVQTYRENDLDRLYSLWSKLVREEYAANMTIEEYYSYEDESEVIEIRPKGSKISRVTLNSKPTI
jgi:hypothetical protein